MFDPTLVFVLPLVYGFYGVFYGLYRNSQTDEEPLVGGDLAIAMGSMFFAMYFVGVVLMAVAFALLSLFYHLT